MTAMAAAALSGTTELPPVFQSIIRAAASKRIMDARDACAAVYTAIPENEEPLVGSRGEGHNTYDLPLISPPRIGITGWWQIEDNIAAIVQQADDDDIVGILAFFWNPDERKIRALNGYTSLLADGTSWDLSIARIENARHLMYAPENAPAIAAEIAMAILLVSSIVQVDPAVITTRTTPPRAHKRGRRVMAPKSTALINLPGLRYDEADRSFRGTGPGGVVWHRVRGHYRHLRSDRFTNAQGTKVWVNPHARGDLSNGASTRGYTVTT